ncbi:MAG: hypothetical protein WB622_13935, partial [Acidobacteriaceae bacterium]
MREAENKAGVAAYLVGHGPLRSPRLIELQWMRIQRYRNLLGAKYETGWTQLEAFVDINFPRADRITDQAFPSWYRLLEAVQDGKVGVVYLDIQEVVGTTHHYGWVPESLQKAGARVVNAYYDTDGALREFLAQRYRDQADVGEIDDTSDFVAFFPALSSGLSRAALRNVLHLPGCEKTPSANELWGQLARLRDRNPYAAGRVPFIQEELEWEWSNLLHKVTESERAERRNRETLFKLAPGGMGLLVDEYPSSEATARTNDELLWAEQRIQSELQFEKVKDGNTVSY